MVEILYFGADGCSQCRYWEPVYRSLCAAKSFGFSYVDAEQDEESVAKFGVRGIPFVVVMSEDGGEELFRGLASQVIDRVRAL